MAVGIQGDCIAQFLKENPTSEEILGILWGEAPQNTQKYPFGGGQSHDGVCPEWEYRVIESILFFKINPFKRRGFGSSAE